MQDGPFMEQLAELAAFAKAELSQAQRDANELRILVRQTSGEVERLTPRHSQAMAKQRECEAKLDSVSREELRQVFAAACESQLRLFMMQSQLEQLQSRQRSVDKYIETLQRIVEMEATVDYFSVEPAAVPAAQPALSSYRDLAPEESPNGQQTIARVIQAQEDERNRVARQIHDGPAQALTNIVLRAEICERLMGVDPARASAEIRHLKDLVTATLRDTRRFIFDVRPMILDDLGLFPTLRKYVETFEEKGEFATEIIIKGQERRLEPEIEIAVFRIVQDALQNVARHAGANKARLNIDAEGQKIEVTVEDDGVGFDVDETLATVRDLKGASYGIADMLQRAEMLGGSVAIDSRPGNGTRVTLTLPLRNLS